MKTGQAYLPLHGGKAPPWLFNRMVKIARPLSEILLLEYGQDEFLKRISNPYFFQSLACVLGFDWHSSGTTTTLTGALKLALRNSNLGIEVAGGKGLASRRAPEEIEKIGNMFNVNDDKIKNLIKSSRLAAKVDNNLIQDTYNLYHHAFFLSEKGKYAIVQQGMSEENRMARRYHWLSDQVSSMIEYDKPIASQSFHDKVLNLTSTESSQSRKISIDLIKENPTHLKKYEKKQQAQATLSNFQELKMPRRHEIIQVDLGNFKALESAYELQPQSYEELMLVKGMGAKTIRALALISNLVYGSQLDWKDPAKYSYAHGGKDGFPFPVDKEIYDKDIDILRQAVSDARLNNKDKLNCLRRMGNLVS
jgi:uncharacterized protein